MDKTAVILVDTIASSYIKQPLNSKNQSSWEIVREKADLLGFTTYAFSKEDRPGFLAFGGDLYSLLHQMDASLTPASHYLFLHTHMPLVDLGLCRALLKAHVANLADYSFAEHYPAGFAPFVLSHSTFKKLLMLSKGNNAPYDENILEKFIHQDINAYDVEILLAPEDMRFIRDAFVITDKRSFSLVQSLIDLEIKADNLLEVFRDNPALLRPLPTLVNIELTSQADAYPLYSAFPLQNQGKGHMDTETLGKILQELSDWAQNAVVDLSGMGDPALHSHGQGILGQLALYPDFRYFFTSRGSQRVFLEEALSLLPQLTVILSLDAADDPSYQIVWGKGDFHAIEETAATLLEKFPGRVYLQFTRMRENEDSLDAFFQRFRVFKDYLLVNKYNSFCNSLPDRKVVDLSPLTRFPCWKLQRELYIHWDGSVSLCAQDFEKLNVLGKWGEKSLKEIWGEMNLIYLSHWQKQYPGLCKNCDEWYIFNF
ncbi:MAG: hypothetical protein CVV50_00170 [Spirochaetae bacterium HGW-Spirochaetae-6]|nr:MAG: hypothetical protein CVV50_00170 [Spirochaetae bacterium HGW-Spirochaetae-6]